MSGTQRRWYDPRDSWVPLALLFVVGLVLAVEESRPNGVLGGGLWIPVIYGLVPGLAGTLSFVRTRGRAGGSVSPLLLTGLLLWSVLGAVAALVVVVIVGLGRPPTNPPSTSLRLAQALVTYLVPVGVFSGSYAVAGRRSRLPAVGVILLAPVLVAVVLGGIVWAV